MLTSRATYWVSALVFLPPVAQAASGIDRLLMVLGKVIAEGAHQLRAPGPDRIRMLALHLVENRGGLGITLLVEPALGEAVESVDVAGDILGVGPGPAAAACAGSERNNERKDQSGGDGALGNAEHGGLLSGGFGGGQAG